MSGARCVTRLWLRPSCSFRSFRSSGFRATTETTSSRTSSGGRPREQSLRPRGQNGTRHRRHARHWTGDIAALRNGGRDGCRQLCAERGCCDEAAVGCGSGGLSDRGAARRPNHTEGTRRRPGAHAGGHRISCPSCTALRPAFTSRLRNSTSRHFDWTMALNVRSFFELIRALMPVLREHSTVVRSLVGRCGARCPRLRRGWVVEGSVGVISAPHGRGACTSWRSREHPLSRQRRDRSVDAFPDKENRLAEAVRRTPAGRLVSWDEVAVAAQFLCSAASRGLVGHTLVIDGGARLSTNTGDQLSFARGRT